MRRLPVLPTLIVAAAVATMIALGVWQLRRAEWKEALLASYAGNSVRPPIALSADLSGAGDALAFRRAVVVCAETRPAAAGAARDVRGRTGYRQALWCRPAAGEPVLVSLGVASDPRTTGATPPRSFQGWLVPRAGRPPEDPAFLLVARTPVPPLIAEAPPSPASVPNNHRAYAVQWFLFAAAALAVYVLALRRRTR